MNTAELEAKSLVVLKNLIITFGPVLVQAVLNTMLGTGGGIITEPESLFVSSMLRTILDVNGEQQVRDEVEAMYRAGDAAASVAERKIFGDNS